MSESLVLMLLVGGSITYLVSCIVLWVLQIVANWKIFTKADEAGWKSIIPVYSGYISYKIAWKPAMFWVSIIATFIGSYGSQMYVDSESGLWLAVMCVGAIACAIINIMFAVKLARAYGKSGGFAVGLIILNPIFLLILGLGKSEYKGPNL